MLRNEFGKLIEIRPCDLLGPVQCLQMQLKHRFKDEAEFIKEISHKLDGNDELELSDILKMYEELALKQYNTDVICEKLKEQNTFLT